MAPHLNSGTRAILASITDRLLAAGPIAVPRGGCGAKADFATADAAASGYGHNVRGIYLCVESSDLPFCETERGPALVCLMSIG